MATMRLYACLSMHSTCMAGVNAQHLHGRGRRVGHGSRGVMAQGGALRVNSMQRHRCDAAFPILLCPSPGTRLIHRTATGGMGGNSQGPVRRC